MAIVELNKEVSESISSDEVDDIQSEVATTYGVDEEDVRVDVVYQTSGTMALENIDGVSEEALEEALEDEIASLLGIHESNVQVNITDGVVYYTITSDSAESASDIRDILDDAESTTQLDDAISETFPEVDVSSIDVNDAIVAEVLVTVDTSDAEKNLDDAASDLEASFEEQGYDTVAESNRLNVKSSIVICT